jgi:hypothetical protein
MLVAIALLYRYSINIKRTFLTMIIDNEFVCVKLQSKNDAL